MNDATIRRLLALVALLAAVCHAFVPRVLLATARWGYAAVLKAEFEPTEATVRRVRLLAVPNLLAAGYLWRSAEDST